MKFKDLVAKYWWMPFVVFLVFTAIDTFFAVYTYQEYFFPYIIGTVGLLAFVTQIVVFFTLLFTKQWRPFIFTSIALIVSILVTLFVGFFTLFMGGHKDHFGARHPIPEGMEYALPDERMAFPMEDDSSTWILLDEDFQPGILNYKIAVPELPDGTVYVDAYEATSFFHLRFCDDHSPITRRVLNHNCFGVIFDDQAMLYDGIWGEPYAVRIVVTFTPDGSSEKQIITSKVYKLEGWQR